MQRNSTSDRGPECDAERRRGYVEGTAFAQRLLEVEDEERAARIGRLLSEATPRRPAGISADRKVRMLESELQSLRYFRRSVVRSLPWRLTQFLRGLVGRRWQV